jgi:hypothetical protein
LIDAITVDFPVGVGATGEEVGNLAVTQYCGTPLRSEKLSAWA